MGRIRFISSKEGQYWKEKELSQDTFEDTLEVEEVYKQTFKGFGGCFNEIGWKALQKLSEEERNKVLDELFGEAGCGFNFGRLPMGASDYALEWYSYDETDGDYELKKFSVERDKEYLIPYAKEALKRCPGMTFFSSPWSPPTWLKTRKAYNSGTLKQDQKTLNTYANYFAKYVQAYEAEGLKIEQVHIQNEPMAAQVFPSCKWTGEEYRDFIKNYIGPLFESLGIKTEIWVGTINEGSTPTSEFFDGFVNIILSDKEARKYISGCGFQWGGKHVLEQTELAYPELRIMQTENECGDGRNSWTYAEYVFGLLWKYFRHRAERYTYWNMVLPEGGASTWGWQQNTMITINEETKTVSYNPEFYVMKHFSHFIKKGAKYRTAKGHLASNSVVFENPNGEVVVVVANSMNYDRGITFKLKEESFSAVLPSHSISTFLIKQ